jgi:hypothetical protein
MHDLVHAEDSWVPVERVLHATCEMSCDTSEDGVDAVLLSSLLALLYAIRASMG